MSREQSRRLVEDLERDLRQALTLEPSADFARQVRARIDQAPMRPPLSRHWPWLAAAAAVFIVAAATWWQVAPVPQSIESAPQATKAATDVPLDLRAHPAPRIEAISPPPRRLPATPRVTGVSEPEVIVSPDVARALARLLQLTRSGAVHGEGLEPRPSPAPPETLSIMPIVVPAIPVPAIDLLGGPAPSGAGPQ